MLTLFIFDFYGGTIKTLKRKVIMNKVKLRALVAIILCTVILLSFSVPSFSNAAEESKTVRVGWYESPFNITGENGSRSGYAYEYERKVASYTGWTYEYVEGSWIELLHMLENGEIDILTDVSYTEERAEKILYPTIPMGQEIYYVYTDSDNTEIQFDDLTTLNGKRVGVTADSIQLSIYLDWEAQRGLTTDLVELDCSEYESLDMLRNGEIDAFVTLDSYGSYYDSLTPVAMIGSSEFYFAVSMSRPDLLAELESALFAIQEEDRYYGQHLYDKYLNYTGSARYLSAAEIDWLEEHGPIRVGYQDNYLAFCACDPSTGELTGALKDYLEFASNGVENAQLEFETIAYPTASAALSALKNGEIDCVFPANMTTYEGETLGVVMSQPLMTTEMISVVRESDQQSFSQKKDIVVAVNEGNPNYDLFVEDNFPDWTIAYFSDTTACLKAVAAGEADCLIISNYRYGNIANLCDQLNLTTLSTGVDLDYYFAMREGDTILYSIMSKVVRMVPESVVNRSLNYYSTQDAKMTFGDYVRSNLGIVMTIVSVILLVFLILTARNLHLVRKAHKEKQHVKDLSRRVNYDALTSVRNKGAFEEYIGNLQTRLDSGESIEAAACICDCNDLKVINDKYGHDKGDEYIKHACHYICTTFRRSAVFRIGGDEFAIVMMNDDYANRDELIGRFCSEQEAISLTAEDPWDQLHIAIGMAVYDPDKDSTLSDTVKRADELMYENKRIWKEKNS